MPATVKYGNVYYLTYTRRELEEMGMKANPHILENRFRFCPKCAGYHYVIAMSRNESRVDCYEVCTICNLHCRNVNSPISVTTDYQNYVKSPIDVRD